PWRSWSVPRTGWCPIARLVGSRVMGVGLGAQDITTTGGKILCRVLGRTFHRLCLRDERSCQQCQQFMPGDSRVVLTSDLAYTMPAEPGLATGAKIIAVTLVEYIFTRAHKGDGFDPYKILAGTLTQMVRDGYRIRLLVLQKSRPDLG